MAAMRVLITGCAGFIGSNLFKRCLDEGWTVSGVDDLSNGHREFMPGYTFPFVGDFAGPQVLRDLQDKKYDVVFHLAAVPRVSYSVKYPLQTHDVNVTRTLELMAAALQPQAEAAQTIQSYASTNPQEYADFRSILTPLSSLQNQCGVSVVPAEYQWAFSQFIG